ncbi:hypothetical protein NQ314_011474 [Rhamnusium bicolor]|uniref:Uncharacterized protein n=1 Tax=Rhamnusium bicolor TaxID=1586634 RepID=A0AAV8XJ25_9CUCU|nr:hypothetical protein NQ314_011474 [Rhamnusium bicolor]
MVVTEVVDITSDNEDEFLEEESLETDDIFDDILENIVVTTTFVPLVSITSLNNKIKMLAHELNMLEANQQMNNLKKLLQEEKVTLELDVTERHFQYLKVYFDFKNLFYTFFMHKDVYLMSNFWISQSAMNLNLNEGSFFGNKC